MQRFLIFVFLFLSLSAQSVYSEDRYTVCVKYKKNSGWSKNYEVEGNILLGSELMMKTGSYQYNTYSHYVVIFWAEDQASILELNLSGPPGYTWEPAKDQEGREWKVSKGSCI